MTRSDVNKTKYTFDMNIEQIFKMQHAEVRITSST
jgi:hypothetical protein